MYELNLGFLLMSYGLPGVFLVLILFIVLIKIINAAFPAEDTKENN